MSNKTAVIRLLEKYKDKVSAGAGASYQNGKLHTWNIPDQFARYEFEQMIKTLKK